MTTASNPDTRTMVRQILRTFDRATPADIEAGAQWYGVAHDVATVLSQESGYSTEQAAAVISHLSPQTTWARNVDGAYALLVDSERGSGILRANYRRAAASLAAADPGASFGPRAQKTRRFYANILGDSNAVTVDTWAARIAGAHSLTRKGEYDSVERAYRSAARRRGVSPATMQATTWVVARNGRAA